MWVRRMNSRFMDCSIKASKAEEDGALLFEARRNSRSLILKGANLMRTQSKLAGLGILVWALALPGTASAQNRTVVSNGPFAQVFWCNEENFCGAVFVFSDGTAQ